MIDQHEAPPRLEPSVVALDDPTWQAALAVGQRLLTRKARSFALATRLLPRQMRDDVAVLYAFCRIADDLADDAADEVGLARLEAELCGQRSPRPVIAALHALAQRHDFPIAYAHTLLLGVQSDLAPLRIVTEEDLLRYSYQVASTVGLMLSRVLGVRDPAADLSAIALGLGMQLTNIVRDVAEDAAKGRVYLPESALAVHGLRPVDLLAGRADRAAVHAVCLDVLELADCCYRVADRGLADIPLRSRFGIAVAARLYAAIGWRIRRTGHHPLDGRMVVPRREKCFRVLQGIVVAMRAVPDRERIAVPTTARGGRLHVDRHVVGHRA
jgi:phytoene synthase